MNPQDAAFVHIEDGNNPMHIGSMVVFEGPAPKYGDFVRMIASKLPLVPRYRQKVREVPFGLGRPVWVDDPNFQILYHIRRTAVPVPGGDEELRNLAGRVYAQNLDRSKPLWELWIVEGLEEGRWAMISKVHHCMVDGVSGSDLLSVIMDVSPDPVPTPHVPWNPGREPSPVHLLMDTIADTIVSPIERIRGLPALARTPIPQGIGLNDLRNMVSSISHWTQPAASSLNGSVGPHRRWSWANGTLADIREIRATLGGTINDVVLTVITRGFRDLLSSRNEQVEGRVVRTLVPVSVRSDSEKGTYNNRVSGLFPGLPVGLDDPVERLQAIRAQMDSFKQSNQAVAADALAQMGGFAPPMLLALGARLGTRFQQRVIQTVTTNVPGPQVPLYALGRQMLYAYPYVPIGGTIRIGIAIFSYMGRLNYGVTADYDSNPDIAVLCQGIEAGVEELLTIARAQKARAMAQAEKADTRPARPRRAAPSNGSGSKPTSAKSAPAARTSRGRRTRTP